MDGLSVAASVAGLLQVTAKVIDFFSTMMGASTIAQNVLAEAKALQAIFHQLQHFILDFADGTDNRRSMIIIDQLVATLTGCVCVFNNLEQVLDGLNIGGQVCLWDSAMWAWKDQDLTRILGDLQKHKSSLNLMLTIINCNSTQQARRDMARLTEFMDAVLMSDPALSERMALFTSQPDRFDHDASSSRSVATLATINNLRVSMSFSFEGILPQAPVYRNANRNRSTQSFKTIITSDTKWSQLSGLSLSQISNISAICLPVNTHELGNSHIVRSMETDSGGESIGLHQAAAMGDSAMVRLLGADKDYNDEIGRTAFSAAANRHDTTDKRKVSVDTKGRTELHIAAMNGRDDVVRSLVELGVDTEARDIMGWTALHSAVQNGRYDVVRLLIQLGVNKTAQDNEGRTALHLATPNCPNDMVRILLELGVNMETRDKYGKTALHWGALYENASNIRLLLEFGANIRAEDREGWTAHTYAVHGRHATTTKLLSGGLQWHRRGLPGIGTWN